MLLGEQLIPEDFKAEAADLRFFVALTEPQPPQENIVRVLQFAPGLNANRIVHFYN